LAAFCHNTPLPPNSAGDTAGTKISVVQLRLLELMVHSLPAFGREHHLASFLASSNKKIPQASPQAPGLTTKNRCKRFCQIATSEVNCQDILSGVRGSEIYCSLNALLRKGGDLREKVRFAAGNAMRGIRVERKAARPSISKNGAFNRRRGTPWSGHRFAAGRRHAPQPNG
jgi:hypothetical protein